MSRRRPRVAIAFAMAASLFAAGAAVAFPSTTAGAAPIQPAAAFTGSKTVTRAHVTGDVVDQVESRSVKVTVSQTKDLRDRQEIEVHWSGARPTAGILADQNSGDARQEEYPVVLLQCRGVDSTSAPASKTISPSTCWTQTYSERYQDDYNTSVTPWRLDHYATDAQKRAHVGEPATLPKGCFGGAQSTYWLPFVAEDGTTYRGGPNGCAGMAPESANVGGSALPSNTTYGVTELDGTGTADFDVWTDQDNASLGCSSTVPCSLVVVPIMGLSCSAAADLPLGSDEDAPTDNDLTKADAACRADGHFAPGQLISAATGAEDLAVSGALWWSASNWRNRITVPLTFAESSSVCDVVGHGAPLDLYGSEVLAQATEQWVPAFCTDPKRFRFKHVQTGEPEARNLLVAGTIDGAFISNPSLTGYSRPVVHAPVAVSGFAITYVIDDAQGRPYTKLRLTPRLLAKLLTESYPAIKAMKDEYEPLNHNPMNITLDPEFIALNPGVKEGVAATEAASTLLTTSSDSDVTWALTAYLNADPEARAWLDGKPDPWGMVVNPNYKGIELPDKSWPLLDTFMPPKFYASRTNDCLTNAPVPFLPLVAAPMSDFASVTQAMQFAVANSRIVCYEVAEGVAEGQKLIALGRQTAGYRFMLGVSTLADADRYQLDTAGLQSVVSGGSGEAFTDGAGRSFVTPSNGSLRQAVSLLEADPKTGTWPIPYDRLRKGTVGATAYPGTMIVYAAVPTHGLKSADAKKLGQLLRFAATSGQTPGTGLGKLPAGYLPITAANHLGALQQYTVAAATAVSQQNGSVPSVDGEPEASSPPAPSGGDGTGGSGGDEGTAGPTSPDAPASPSPSASAAGDVRLVAVGTTPALAPGPTGLAFPALALLAAVAAALAGITALRARP